MIEVLNTLGDVSLVDIAYSEPAGTEFFESGGVRRVRVNLSPAVGKVTRHLRLWYAVLREAWRRQPEVVVAEDFFTTLPGWLASRMARSRLVYDAHELIIPGEGERLSRRDRFWYSLERWVAPRSDLVIAANPERAALMAEHYGLERQPESMRNIPSPRQSGRSRDDITHVYPALARRDSTDRVLLYQGDVSVARELDRFVEALAHLPGEYRLIIAGAGPDLERLKTLGQPWASEGRFSTLGRVPIDLLPAVTASADVGIVAYSFAGLNNFYCAPNKVFEYAQAGIPVIATGQPPLRALVEPHGIGLLIGRDERPEDVARVVADLFEDIASFRAPLADFVSAHRWEDEATRVRDRIRESTACGG